MGRLQNDMGEYSNHLIDIWDLWAGAPFVSESSRRLRVSTDHDRPVGPNHFTLVGVEVTS